MNELELWKSEVGEIPENTCPTIDKCIKILRNIIKDVDNIKRWQRRYETPDEVFESLPDFSDLSDVESMFEDLRADNDQLRNLGKFWYEKCIELYETQTKKEANPKVAQASK